MESSKKLINHRNFKDTFDHLYALLNFHDDQTILCLVGVGGVGKSSVKNQLIKALTRRLPTGRHSAPYVPLVDCECVTQADAKFDWHDWYERMLIHLCEPGIRYKTIPTKEELTRLSTVPYPPLRQTRISSLRLSMEKALSMRRTQWVFMDEAHSLTRVRSGALYLGQLESLKSLSNTTQTMLFLVGTYELLDLFVPNSQLSRRAIIVEYPPYDASVESDRKEFARTIKGLASQSPIPINCDFPELTEFLYECSLGVIGIASDIISRSYVIADSKNMKAITMKTLKLFKPLAKNLETLQNDINEGRQWFREGAIRGDSYSTLDANSSQGEAPHKTNRRRPGRRNPSRDKVAP